MGVNLGQMLIGFFNCYLTLVSARRLSELVPWSMVFSSVPCSGEALANSVVIVGSVVGTTCSFFWIQVKVNVWLMAMEFYLSCRV